MPLNASESERKVFPLIPEDMYPAVCYAVIELGTHYNARYNKEKHEVLFIWELKDDSIRIMVPRDEEEVSMPRAISNRYNITLDERANLRKMLDSWRGRSFTPEELKKFDLSNCLGKSCQVQITHGKSADGLKTYANVNNVIKAPRGTTFDPENNPVFFSFEDNGTNIPEELPGWIEDEIKSSNEYNKLTHPPEHGEEPSGYEGDDPGPASDDDIPF